LTTWCPYRVRKEQGFCLLVPAGGDNGRNGGVPPPERIPCADTGGETPPFPRDRPGQGEWIMAAIDEDDRPKKKTVHEIGQDLSLLSIEELGDRIALLEDEKARLQAAMERKRASRSAADQFFKR
jgi:uncharacterized small protein (DUF1192 family)